MRKKVKPIPGFRREEDERQFWHTHDTTDYFDFPSENRVEIEFDRGVEAPLKSISLRLPREMLNELKALATKKDVPYQSGSRSIWRIRSTRSEEKAEGNE